MHWIINFYNKQKNHERKQISFIFQIYFQKSRDTPSLDPSDEDSTLIYTEKTFEHIKKYMYMHKILSPERTELSLTFYIYTFIKEH